MTPVLLERLRETCSVCASEIDAARESFETEEVGTDFYSVVVGAGLEQIRQHLEADHMPPELPAQVNTLRRLSLQQRTLRIRNNPAAWDDVRLGEAIFALAQAALPADPGASLDWALTAREIAATYRNPWPAHHVLADAYEGNAHRVLGDYPQARRLLGKALHALEAEEIADLQIIALVHSLAGSLSYDEGDLLGSADHLETAANSFMQGQDSQGLIRTTMQLARVYGAQRDYVAAIHADRAALAALDDSHPLYLEARLNLAFHLEASGACQAAREALAFDLERFEALVPWRRVRVTWLQARLAVDAGDFGTAEMLYGSARDQFAQTPDPFRFAHASLELAQLLYRQSRTEDLIRVCGEALQVFRANAHDRDALGCLMLVHQAAAAKVLTAERLERSIVQFRSLADNPLPARR